MLLRPRPVREVTGVFQFDDPIEFAQAVASKTSSAVSDVSTGTAAR